MKVVIQIFLYFSLFLGCLSDFDDHLDMNPNSQRSFLSSYLGFSPANGGSAYWFFPAVEKTTEPVAAQNFTTNFASRNYGRLFGYLPDILQDFLIFILDNPFVGVIGLGSLIALIKEYFWRVYAKFCYRYTTTLEVSSEYQTFIWLENWLNAKDWGNCQHVSGVVSQNKLTFSHREDCECPMCKAKEQPGAPNFQLIPNLAHYGFQYKGLWIDVAKSQDKEKTEEKAQQQYGMEDNKKVVLPHQKKFMLTTTGKNPSIFHHLLSECRQIFIDQTKYGTCMWSASSYGIGDGEWMNSGQHRKRPFESVILDRGVLDELMADLKKFIGSSNWYINRGIPYRRGYLLHGPPGCGKTSVISAIAAYLDYGVSILSLNNRNMTDDAVRTLMNSVPEKTILLLEDIDAAFDENRNTKVEGRLGSLSFSGLLNAIDGIASADSRILFMTTNYIDRLDSALIRPGRIDCKKKIDYCTEYQVRAFFERFYPELEEQLPVLAEKFVAGFKCDNVAGGAAGIVQLSPAQLQGYLLMYRDDPEDALENIDSFLEELKAQEAQKIEVSLKEEKTKKINASKKNKRKKKCSDTS